MVFIIIANIFMFHFIDYHQTLFLCLSRHDENVMKLQRLRDKGQGHMHLLYTHFMLKVLCAAKLNILLFYLTGYHQPLHVCLLSH